MSVFFICLILELCEISDFFFLSHFEPVSGSQSSRYERALVLRPSIAAPVGVFLHTREVILR